MGTRSMTIVKQGDTVLLAMYRQMDGYPEGHGLELAEFLAGFSEITNGIKVGEKRKTANGMGCLAAQLVAHFKTEVGGFYLSPTDSKPGESGDEYFYTIEGREGKPIRMTCTSDDGNEMVFTGTAQEFLSKYAQQQDNVG